MRELGPSQIHLWQYPIGDPPDARHLARAMTLLSDAEKKRCAAFHMEKHRRRVRAQSRDAASGALRIRTREAARVAVPHGRKRKAGDRRPGARYSPVVQPLAHRRFRRLRGRTRPATRSRRGEHEPKNVPPGISETLFCSSRIRVLANLAAQPSARGFFSDLDFEGSLYQGRRERSLDSAGLFPFPVFGGESRAGHARVERRIESRTPGVFSSSSPARITGFR